MGREALLLGPDTPDWVDDIIACDAEYSARQAGKDYCTEAREQIALLFPMGTVCVKK